MPKRGRSYRLAGSGRARKRQATSRYRVYRRNRSARYPGGSIYGRNPALRNMRSGGLLGIETKYLDCSATNTAFATPTNCSGGEFYPTSGCTNCLSAPAVGDGASNRDGKKIVIKSCFIQGVIDIDPQTAQTSLDTPPCLFVCLVQDTQTNGQPMNSEDVFINPAGSANLAAIPFRNMSNTSRFKILDQYRVNLGPVSGTNNASANTVMESGINHYFKLSWKGIMPVNFSIGSTTADVANVIDNSLCLVGFASGITMSPTLNFVSRVRFVG